MTPQAFITQWGPGGPAYSLNEEQGVQSHFLDLCALLGVPKPGSLEGYRFEERSQLIGERTGYADVFYPGHFAWENKVPSGLSVIRYIAARHVRLSVTCFELGVTP